jgi:alkanesulfonate monooxygenase SsuD/methylene tetrahydromethanopterin reductase-like flavin-dependent oxidoreductase (luciferase family)
LNVPQSPQRHPVIIQAGSSGRGKEFAARWAEVVFTIQPNIARAKDFSTDLKLRMAAYNRAPEDCKILTAVMPFIGETEAKAREKQSLHNELVHPLVGLSTLSNHTNYDLGFVISPAYLPGAFEEFVKSVVPELQQRGLFRTEYTGKTLREHLRLKYP